MRLIMFCGLLTSIAASHLQNCTFWVETYPQTLYAHMDEVRDFVANNPAYNAEIAFLIDMKLPSGKNRFFVCDLKSKKVIDQGLVAHGYGSETGEEGKLIFSNVVNSNRTSLGKYRIGQSYIGQFGKAYRLHGLDATNSNALQRYVVLHSFSEVPEHEQDLPICNSLGCPMVHQNFFNRIAKRIDGSNQSMILYIYY